MGRNAGRTTPEVSLGEVNLLALSGSDGRMAGVEFVTGGKRKAYAKTNRAEYFAELTEAYFGKNDFYPFTRAELEKHDPVGFKLMKDAWGDPRQ